MSAGDSDAANLLRDLAFELNQMLEESSGASSEYRAGMFHVVAVLYHQLDAFDVDQSEWPRPLINPETWFLRGADK